MGGIGLDGVGSNFHFYPVSSLCLAFFLPVCRSFVAGKITGNYQIAPKGDFTTSLFGFLKEERERERERERVLKKRGGFLGRFV